MECIVGVLFSIHQESMGVLTVTETTVTRMVGGGGSGYLLMLGLMPISLPKD